MIRIPDFGSVELGRVSGVSGGIDYADWAKRCEELYVPGRHDPITLPPTSQALDPSPAQARFPISLKWSRQIG